MRTQPAGGVGLSLLAPVSPGDDVAAPSVSCPAPGTAARGRRLFWAFLFLIPGGVLVALGALLALPGLVLLWSGLRRLSTAPAGKSVAPVRICHRDSKPARRSHEEPHEPRPRVAPTATGVH